jgi:predicted nucleic acid-binding protein
VAEACYLLRGFPAAEDALLRMIEENLLQVPFAIRAEASRVRALRLKYRDVPMSLADACLVRMAELVDGSTVCTLDDDFAVYRKSGRRAIPLLTPA